MRIETSRKNIKISFDKKEKAKDRSGGCYYVIKFRT